MAESHTFSIIFFRHFSSRKMGEKLFFDMVAGEANEALEMIFHDGIEGNAKKRNQQEI